MARQAKPDAVVLEASVNEAAFSQGSENLNALALVNTKVNAAAQALAEELGYDGALSVGTLEDEIRFYQRRTVEACLELGKRLLLLREMTAHGNSCQIGTNQDATRGNSSQIGTNQGFDKRVEQLGFSRSTAYRFMQAAAKTAKSANLAVLSTQVKSASAFLELVTHDSDEDIERVAKLDDIDRMSASQLRAALRESREDAKASEKRRSVLLQQKEKLEEDLAKEKAASEIRIAQADPEVEQASLLQETTARAHKALAYVRGDLRHAFEALQALEGGPQGAGTSHRNIMAGFVNDLQNELDILRADFFLPLGSEPA